MVFERAKQAKSPFALPTPAYHLNIIIQAVCAPSAYGL